MQFEVTEICQLLFKPWTGHDVFSFKCHLKLFDYLHQSFRTMDITWC